MQRYFPVSVMFTSISLAFCVNGESSRSWLLKVTPSQVPKTAGDVWVLFIDYSITKGTETEGRPQSRLSLVC